MTAPTYDTVIIGAGILGAATAWQLSQFGQRVIVVEAATAASGATGNSFSWLNAVAKEPEAYHRLNAAGAAEYGRLESALGRAFRHRGGSLEWTADEDSISALREKVARLQARGYAAEIVDGRAVRELEPHLRIAPDTVAAFYPEDSWVDAPAVATALLTDARARGAQVREGVPVTGFHRNGDRVFIIEAGGEWMTAAAVVVCAGTATPSVLHMLGQSLPIERRPGLLAVTTPVGAGVLSRVVHAPGIHLRPDVGGGLRLGADDTDALTLEDTPMEPAPAGCSILLHRAAALLALPPSVTLARALVGVRPVPADGLTVAGRLSAYANVFVAVTHSGITLGPLLGRLLAEEILRGTPSPWLSAFRPDRFDGMAAR